jgi:hypothetical protein
MDASVIRIKPGTPRSLDATDNPSLADYERRIDAILSRSVGLSLADLSDVPTADWLADRVRPVYAARKAVRASGGF